MRSSGFGSGASNLQRRVRVGFSPTSLLIPGGNLAHCVAFKAPGPAGVNPKEVGAMCRILVIITKVLGLN
jgi:hypothetical protein